MIINDIKDFSEYLGTTVDRVKRDVYKYSECGAWVEWNDKTLTVGSIVEGSDAEFSNIFQFPFDSSEYDTYIEELEELTDTAWREANEEF